MSIPPMADAEEVATAAAEVVLDPIPDMDIVIDIEDDILKLTDFGRRNSIGTQLWTQNNADS